MPQNHVLLNQDQQVLPEVLLRNPTVFLIKVNMMKDIEHTQTATIITPINCVISKAVPPPKNKPKVPSLAGVLHANNPTARCSPRHHLNNVPQLPQQDHQHVIFDLRISQPINY